ncbi:MAG: carbonic anhydrase family protein [Caldimonas sp.]
MPFASFALRKTVLCLALFLASAVGPGGAQASDVHHGTASAGESAAPATSKVKPDAVGHDARETEANAEPRPEPKARRAGAAAKQTPSVIVPTLPSVVAIGERIAERIRARSAVPSRELVIPVVAHSVSTSDKVAVATPARPLRGEVKSAHDGKSAHWDYQGAEGPQSWARLRPEFVQCSAGTRQSPINIEGGIKVQLDPVAFDYRPGAFRVIDNGHTVQVNIAPGSSIEVMGRRFELVQFHFHRPSEERIDGRQFDMVVHLVHKDLEGRLAVVAVLLERGSAQPLIQSVWNNLPLEKGDEVAARTMLDPASLLPAERTYYTYMGSLTTPPCSEGVLWMVMKKPMPISAEQIGIFARLYPMNARPLQSASGRLIKESE